MENQASKPRPENFASLPKLSDVSSLSQKEAAREAKAKARMAANLRRKNLARIRVEVEGLTVADVLTERTRIPGVVEAISKALGGSIVL